MRQMAAAAATEQPTPSRLQEAQVCAACHRPRRPGHRDVLPHPANRRRSESWHRRRPSRKSEQYCGVTQPGSVLGSYPEDPAPATISTVCARRRVCAAQRGLLSPKGRGMADHSGLRTGRQRVDSSAGRASVSKTEGRRFDACSARTMKLAELVEKYRSSRRSPMPSAGRCSRRWPWIRACVRCIKAANRSPAIMAKMCCRHGHHELVLPAGIVLAAVRGGRHPR